MTDQVGITATATSQVSRTVRPTMVYIRKKWSEKWTLYPYLTPYKLDLLPAGKSTAAFHWRYGRIIWPEHSGYVDYPAYNWRDFFVQIRTLTDQGDEHELFTGYIVSDSIEPYGSDAEVDQGTQTINAVELSFLLHREIPWRVIAAASAGTTRFNWVERVPGMNARAAGGIGIAGNRSTDPDGDGIYHFSPDGAVWTHKQYIDMLLNDYPVNGITFALTGQSSLLSELITSQRAAGMPIGAMLDRLIDRRRGLTWRTGPAGFEANPTIGIEVSSCYDQAVTVGNTTIVPNASPVELDLTDVDDIQSVHLQLQGQNSYDRIRVLGEQQLVCFSLRAGEGGELEPGWTPEQETAYKNAASSEVGYDAMDDAEKQLANDRRRGDDVFRSVYTTLRLPDDWDWTSDGSSLLPYGVYHYYNAERTFQRKVPLSAGYDYSGYASSSPVNNNPANVVPEFLPLLVFIKHENNYYPIDRVGDIFDDVGSIGVRVSDAEPAIILGAKPNHVLAANHWISAEPSKTQPKFDYEDIICTVAMRTDKRLTVVASPPDQLVNEGSEDLRELVIEVPGAEWWWLKRRTVVGSSNTSGFLSRSLLLPNYKEGYVLRDDTDYLSAVAAAALAWYGTPRQSMALTVNDIWIDAPVCSLVRGITTAETRETINTIITRVSYNFERNTTQVRTGFVDLDFSNLAAGGHPAIGDASAVARTVFSHEQLIRQLVEDQQNLPVRTGGGSPGGGAATFNVYKRISDHGTGGQYNCRLQTWTKNGWSDADSTTVVCRWFLESAGHMFDAPVYFLALGPADANGVLPVVPLGYAVFWG